MINHFCCAYTHKIFLWTCWRNSRLWWTLMLWRTVTTQPPTSKHISSVGAVFNLLITATPNWTHVRFEKEEMHFVWELSIGIYMDLFLYIYIMYTYLQVSSYWASTKQHCILEPAQVSNCFSLRGNCLQPFNRPTIDLTLPLNHYIAHLLVLILQE